MFFPASTLLHALALSASASTFAAAQTPTPITTDELYGKISSTAAPAPGFNVNGGSVFTNFVDAVNNGQLFSLQTGSFVYEKPESETVQFTVHNWCSDLTFSDFSNSSLMGYAGRCVTRWVDGAAEGQAAGGQAPGGENTEGNLLTWTSGISAVYVEQQNIFEGQLHSSTDDYALRYWDDGSKTAPTIGWEGHDEGDMTPNAATSSLSNFGELIWVSVEEVAQLFNTSVDEFTPEKFKQVYMNIWIKEHAVEAETNNPNPEAELAIIEQVKNETNSAGEAMSPAAPNTEEDGNGESPIEDDDSAGSGRKLTSVAARFVSACLRVFGI
jgi:hypothetical protein